MRIKRGYKIRNIAGESVVVAPGTPDVNLTRVTSLNDTSCWLWESLGDEEFDAGKIASLLTARYDVDEATALRDAKAWIDSIKEAGLTEE